MPKNFRTLIDKMSPESRARAEARAQAELSVPASPERRPQFEDDASRIVDLLKNSGHGAAEAEYMRVCAENDFEYDDKRALTDRIRALYVR
jgi:hypothetical protein